MTTTGRGARPQRLHVLLEAELRAQPLRLGLQQVRKLAAVAHTVLRQVDRGAQRGAVVQAGFDLACTAASTNSKGTPSSASSLRLPRAWDSSRSLRSSTM